MRVGIKTFIQRSLPRLNASQCAQLATDRVLGQDGMVNVLFSKHQIITHQWNRFSRSLQGTLTPEEVAIGTLAGLLEALHNGVTTILDHFHAAHTPEHAEAALKATIESGARVIWAPARQSPPTRLLPFPEWANDAQAVQWQRAKIKEWGSRAGGKLRPDGRVTLGLAYEIFSWEGTVSTHQEFLAYARANNVQTITAHVVKSPAILGWRDAGLLGPDVVLSHCNALADRPELDDEMWKALKDSGAAIGATPADELGMAHGNPVAFDALKRGVKCGLGAVRTHPILSTGTSLTGLSTRIASRSTAATSSRRCASASNGPAATTTSAST